MRILENVNRPGLILVSPFGIERFHCIFSLSKFLNQYVYVLNRSIQPRISNVKFKPIISKSSSLATVSSVPRADLG